MKCCIREVKTVKILNGRKIRKLQNSCNLIYKSSRVGKVLVTSGAGYISSCTVSTQARKKGG